MHAKPLLLACLTAASLAASVAVSAPSQAQSASGAYFGSPSGHAFAPRAKACYSNLANDSGTGLYSTKTKNPATYTAAGAADVVLSKPCKVTRIQANGVLIPGNPVKAVTVYVYADKSGLPGKLIGKAKTTGDFATQNFDLTLKKPVTIPAGTSWVSVQATGEYATNGWYWETSTTVKNGVDVWQNPGGAFGHCSTWDTVANCFGVNYDYLLQIN